MNVLILVISAFLIFLYLLQENKTEGILGSNQIYKNIKERGPEKFLFILTGVLSAVFMILTLIKGGQ